MPLSESRADVLHFINLREWEKGLSLTGDEFIIFPNLGLQPANTLDQRNSTGIHWWFWEKCYIDELNLDKETVKTISRNSIKINCLIGATNRKLDYTRLQQRFPELDEYLLSKYSVSNNIETLAFINSTEQIERAVAIIDMLKVKLNWRIEQLSLESSESYEVEPAEPAEPVQPTPHKPIYQRTMSAADVHKIMNLLGESSDSNENTPPQHSKSILQRISPRFMRKNKNTKK